MIQRKKKIVLFLPHRADPGRGETFSADLLPLELLQIATGPVADGYEVVMIDAMIEPDYLAKIDEACRGALLFASSCILGYQVYDGYGEEVLPSNMVLKGEEMIDSEFPLLSRVVSARRVEQPPAEPEL